MASSGILKGSKNKILAGPRMGDTVQAISIPINGVVGLMLEYPKRIADGVMITQSARPNRDWEEMVQEHADARHEIQQAKRVDHELDGIVIETAGTSRNLEGLKYKARPLNGIWATAPYLHNGSVPDLWSLLLPPGDRPEAFWVGSRRFDPKKVGFVMNRGKSQFLTKDRRTGKIIEGNSNYGHPWGTTLSEEDRWALIEYMKTL